MTPAKGSFTFIDNINFHTDVGSAESAEALLASIKGSDKVMPGSDENKAARDDDETSVDDDSEPPTDKNDEADPPVVATPKLRATPDAAGRVKKSKPAVATTAPDGSTPAVAAGSDPSQESGLMRSMRKFFGRRTGDEESNPEAAQQLKAEQKNLRKQQKVQNGQLQPFQPSQPQQQPPPPKKKRFLIF